MQAPLIWNRKLGCFEKEQIYGGTLLKLLYQNPLGQWLVDHLFSAVWFSQWMGWYASTAWSQRGIKRFIRRFQIPIQEFEEKEYLSFNDFFIRRYRPELRPFEEQAALFPAFCEGRYLAYSSLGEDQVLRIKSFTGTLQQLLGGHPQAHLFLKGPCLIARLCPTDYHRFHFPDSGQVLEQYRIPGRLHSVHPVALRYRPDIFQINERQVALLATEHFGKLAYLEIGALGVGKILQTYPDDHFVRGQEKGYFLFGGSTVVVIGQPGYWTPDPDLVAQTQLGYETLVCLGQSLGKALDFKPLK